MREKYGKRVEGGRILKGEWATEPGEHNGMFLIRLPRCGEIFKIIAGRGLGWEHVSISLSWRCPTWDEMSAIKRLFWNDDETVVQYHPAKSDYVNQHPYCLHLWRPIDVELPTPDTIMV
jgi:hypothetical protein